jgi:hypothetical protein
MKYLYVGTVLDVLADNEIEVILHPETEVEIPDSLQALPYFQRLFTNGLLKTVSPSENSENEVA